MKYSARESSLLYAGYLLVTLSQHKVFEGLELTEVLQACGKRAISSQLPSCVKSFIMPIAYQFSVVPQPDKLLAIFDSPTELLWKWILMTPKFSDDASKVSYLGLLGVLRACKSDLNIAGLKIKKGGEYAQTDEVILL
jgi:hypothetical protein